MSAPVMTDDLVQGAVLYLQAQPAITAVLGTSPKGNPLLFQHSLWTGIENTQSTAAVISRAGGWAGPNLHNTLRFPRLSVEIYVDPIRDAGANIVDPGEAQRRADQAFDVFDCALHRPQGGVQLWGGIRTLSCARLAEPVTYPVPDGAGLLRLQTFYAVQQG